MPQTWRPGTFQPSNKFNFPVNAWQKQGPNHSK
jgi:hypothetical protein